jgi:DNA-binding response OmpR family regulator
MRLLVVEDDRRLRNLLCAGLERNGHEVKGVSRASEALRELESAEPPETVLLDLTLPDTDGLTLCRQIRATSGVPIIIVTARDSVHERVDGLRFGADDYLTKPFHLAELLARIDAVTRRTAGAESPDTAETDPSTARPLVFGPLVIDPAAHVVTVAGAEVQLTLKEFDLLTLLASQPGIVFRREQIIDKIWEGNREGAGRTLESHVASLRAKLGIRFLIETVRGVGYRLGRG